MWILSLWPPSLICEYVAHTDTLGLKHGRVFCALRAALSLCSAVPHRTVKGTFCASVVKTSSCGCSSNNPYLLSPRKTSCYPGYNEHLCLHNMPAKIRGSVRNQWEVFVVRDIYRFPFVRNSTNIRIISQKEKAAPQSLLLGHSASYLSK